VIITELPYQLNNRVESRPIAELVKREAAWKASLSCVNESNKEGISALL